MSRRVVVVGAGLAGLSTAVRLADAGAAVTVLESRPRCGGATHSFRRETNVGTLTVDNGQHVFLRCCTAYRGFLDRLGTTHLAPIQPRLRVPVRTPDGRSGQLARGGLPAPFHLLDALARYRLLRPADKLRAARAALALGRLDPDDPALDQRSFGEWLHRHGQRAAADHALWELVTVATLNAELSEASLALAVKVFRTGLLGAADAADIGVAGVSLSALHVDPAVRLLGRLGATVRTGARVRSVTPQPGGGFSVLADDEVYDADVVVLAVPHDAAATLLPAGAHPDPAMLAGLGQAPIVNVHVCYDRRVLTTPFLAGVDTPLQWVFDRGPATGRPAGRYVAVSLSAADDWIGQPTAAIRTALLPELARLLPAARAARVEDFFVTRERAATFRQAPGSRSRRPGPRTGLPGLYLAGAWTDTGWPATMEGAVRSGQTAASAVLTGVGRQDSAGPDSARRAAEAGLVAA